MDKQKVPFRVELKNISLFLGEYEIFNDLSLGLKQGCICGLVGGNGSGKTTLLNLLSGVILPRKGQIIINGERVTYMPAWKRALQHSIARSFQVPCLADHLSGLDNLIVPKLVRHSFLRILGTNRLAASFRQEARNYWRQLELTESWLTKPALEMSYGQRRILDVVRCLFSGSAIMLLDEPFANVHRDVADAISLAIKTVKNQSPDISVLIVSHEHDILSGLVDEIIESPGGG